MSRRRGWGRGGQRVGVQRESWHHMDKHATLINKDLKKANTVIKCDVKSSVLKKKNRKRKIEVGKESQKSRAAEALPSRTCDLPVTVL